MAGREKGLLLLLKAPSKATVNQLFVYTFEHRYEPTNEENFLYVAKELKVTPVEGQAVSHQAFTFMPRSNHILNMYFSYLLPC
jgi:hypothetical protein